MSTVRCTRRHCGALCGARTDGMGRVVFVCRPCERNRAGFCRDCPAKRSSSWSMRCKACAKRRALELSRTRDRERYPRRRRKVLKALQQKYRIPEVREYRRQYMVNYRAAHPRDGLDRAYNRAYMAARRADPEYRDKQNARRREIRAARRAQGVPADVVRRVA